MRLGRDTLCQAGTLDNYVGTGTNVTLVSNVTMVSFESMATVPTFVTFVLVLTSYWSISHHIYVK